ADAGPRQREEARGLPWRRRIVPGCCGGLSNIITGAPGPGKTAIIRQLELDGFSVVEEAATDVIAAAHAQGTLELWRHPSFIDAIAHLQRDRVLGQREMESRRSPLASKLRFS